MPIAGNKICSLLAISGMPSRVTSSPPFPAGTGSRPPSTAPTAVSGDPGVEHLGSVPLPPKAAWVQSAPLERSGRRSGLVSLASWSCRLLSTAILNTKRNHEPKKPPSGNQELGGKEASTANLSPAMSSSGLCGREPVRARPIAGGAQMPSGPDRPPFITLPVLLPCPYLPVDLYCATAPWLLSGLLLARDGTTDVGRVGWRRAQLWLWETRRREQPVQAMLFQYHASTQASLPHHSVGTWNGHRPRRCGGSCCTP